MERLAFNIKQSEDISGEAYIQSSYVNARVLLNLKIFIIPDAIKQSCVDTDPFSKNRSLLTLTQFY